MVVRLDGDDRRQIAFDTKEYNQIEHGFASTLHRAQGRSVEQVVVYAGPYWNRELAYVAMTRQRERVQLHWDKQTFRDREQLYAKLGSSAQKVNVQDFALQEQEVRRMARVAEQVRQPGRQRDASRDEPDRFVGMKAEIMEAQKLHVEAKQAWETFKAEHPTRDSITRKDAVEAGKLYKAEREAREARIEVEQRSLQVGRELEPQRAVVGSPYESMSAQAIMARTVELRIVARRQEMTAQEAFKALPEVQHAAHQLDEAARVAQRCKLQRERWEQAHPVKAKLGVGEGAKLGEQEKQALAVFKRAHAHADAISGDRGLQGKAREQAGQHNREIKQAKVELKAIGPHHERARRELAQARELKLKLEHKLGRGPGHGL